MHAELSLCSNVCTLSVNNGMTVCACDALQPITARSVRELVRLWREQPPQ